MPDWKVLQHGAEVVPRHGLVVLATGVVGEREADVAARIREEFVGGVERAEISEGLGEGRLRSRSVVRIPRAL
jgi:hypothetical protein